MPRSLVRMESHRTTKGVAATIPESPPPRSPAPASSVGDAATAVRPGAAVDLKAVQRKAYERGRAHAEQEGSDRLNQVLQAFLEAQSQLQSERTRDRGLLATFAVDLAFRLTEELLATVIAEDGHDLRSMVRRALDEAMPEAPRGGYRVVAHPQDVPMLPASFVFQGVEIPVVAEPGLTRGSFRVLGPDLDYYAGLSERLSDIKILLAAGEDGNAP